MKKTKQLKYKQRQIMAKMEKVQLDLFSINDYPTEVDEQDFQPEELFEGQPCINISFNSHIVGLPKFLEEDGPTPLARPAFDPERDNRTINPVFRVFLCIICCTF